MFHFIFDRKINGHPYPNLAPEISLHNGYHGLGMMYPFVIPLRILYYAQDHDFPVNISYIYEDIPENAFYPIGLHFFNFDIDYFQLLSDKVKDLCRNGALKILFYYHEGDSPYDEEKRLEYLCHKNNLPLDCYVFISGNTVADNLKRFVYFADHELFYWRNSVIWNRKSMDGNTYHENRRNKQFTMLSRIHKNWRATITSQFHRLGLLDSSFWSYNMVDGGAGDCLITDNPLRIKAFKGLQDYINSFLSGAPYACDTLSSTEHNSHWTYVPEHYSDSYCSLVLETLYDADGSGGSFLTEKTFKPIRHAHPFILFGPPNSLAILRSLGYRTFDDIIDNRYDLDTDNTKRFIKSTIQVKRLHKKDMHEWFLSAKDDILHNQDLFLSSKYDRLNKLYQKIIGKQ